jgi:tetratricopeptide (TPR) repeat protein
MKVLPLFLVIFLVCIVIFTGCTTKNVPETNVTATPANVQNTIPVPDVTIPEETIVTPVVDKKIPEPSGKNASLAKDLYKKGLALYRKDKNDQANEYFDEALQLDPGNAAIWLSKGDALAKSNLSGPAYEAYEQVVALDLVNNTDLCLKIGHYYNTRDSNKAITHFQKLIDMNSSIQAEAWAGIGYTYELQYMKEGAKEAYNKAIELDPRQYGWCGGEFYNKRYNWCQVRG